MHSGNLSNNPLENLASSPQLTLGDTRDRDNYARSNPSLQTYARFLADLAYYMRDQETMGRARPADCSVDFAIRNSSEREFVDRFEQ